MSEPVKAATSAPAKPNPPAPTEPVKTEPAAPQEPQQPVMSPEDAAELAQFRAEKERKAQLQAATITKDGKANLDLDPIKDREAFLALAPEDQIRSHYLYARGTIQDYARLYNKTVPEVLGIVYQPEMAEVETMGDLIDESELQKGDAPIQATGQVAKVPFSLN